MADSKITDLTAATSLGPTDAFVIVQGGATKQITANYVNPVLGAALSASTTTTSDTAVDVPGLSVALLAGRTYLIEMMVPLVNGGSGEFEIGFGNSGGLTATTLSWFGYSIRDNASPRADVANGPETAFGTGYYNTGSNIQFHASGILVVNVAGNLTVQVKRHTANGTITIPAGAWIRATQIA